MNCATSSATTLKKTVDEMDSLFNSLNESYQNIKSDSDNLLFQFKSIIKLLEETESDEHLTKQVQEMATLSRVVIYKLLDSCSNYVNDSEKHYGQWKNVLEQVFKKKCKLEEMVELLAQQLSIYEQQLHEHNNKLNDEETEFYDCVNDALSKNERNNNTNLIHSDGFSESPERIGTSLSEPSEMSCVSLTNISGRRTSIPEKPNRALNVWSFLKTCIGKDLTRISVPVSLCEPLSMLQRLAEDFEYSFLLDRASNCSDMHEQVAYLAAFIVSGYSTTSDRTTKPFNPLLGETYECDRTDDLGWKLIAEQVSHHPPIAAEYCAGRGWKYWQDFSITSKFRGKYIQVTPICTAIVEFVSSGNRFSWSKVTTTVHNIIIGKLWLDHSGELVINGHGNAAGIKANLKFIPYSYFNSSQQRKVEGRVLDAENNVRYVIDGYWDSTISIAPVQGLAASTSISDSQEALALKTIWRKRDLRSDAEKYYNFTTFAMQLNETESSVAPTDSRLRPDQRAMECGNWEQAQTEKLRLEQKQRKAAQKRQKNEGGVDDGAEMMSISASMPADSENSQKPAWFTRTHDPHTGLQLYTYTDEYWTCKQKQDWSRCNNIF